MFKTHYSRWGSPAIFAAVALAFLLPFATVSCDEEVTFTGVQLAVAQVPADTAAEEMLADDVEGSTPWAFLALTAAVVGLGLGIAARRGGGIAATVGLLAMLLLVWDALITLADVRLHLGFGLACVGYLAIAIHHGVAARRRRNVRRLAAAAPLAALAVLVLSGCGGGADAGYVDFDTADARPAWSSANEIAFTRNGGIFTIEPDGSCTRHLTRGGEPAWSPDGTRLAISRCTDDRCTIVIVERDGSRERELVTGQFSTPRWSHDGRRIHVTREEKDGSYRTWVIEADGTRLRRVAPPLIEASDARWSIGAATEADATFSPDGKRYAFASSNDRTVGIDDEQDAIFVRSVAGGKRTQLSDPPRDAGDYEPAWSPDGTRIAFQRSGEIAVMNADGSDQRVLTRVDGATTSAWSPDSTEIVFTREVYAHSWVAEPSALMIVDVESGDTRRLTWGPKPVAPCRTAG